MKLYKERLYFFLFFILSNNFCLSKDYDDYCMKMEDEIYDIKKMNVSVCELINFYKKSSIVHKFLETINVENLLIIIADDMNDGIMLADVLSNGNRIKLDTEEHSNEEVTLYNEILQNIYFYYCSSKMAHIFVYPRKSSNRILSTYITKMVIKSDTQFKVAFTCKNTIETETLHSMFWIASNTLDIDIQRRRCEMEYNIIFVPLSTTDYRKCTLDMEKLKDYFHTNFERFMSTDSIDFEEIESKSVFKSLTRQEQLEFLVIKPLINDDDYVNNTCSTSLRVLENDYVSIKKLIEFNNFLTPAINMNNEECLKSIQSNETYFISDLHSLPDWLLFSSKNISVNELANEESISKLIESICSNIEENLRFFEFLCFITNIVDNKSAVLYLQQIVRFYLEHH